MLFLKIKDQQIGKQNILTSKNSLHFKGFGLCNIQKKKKRTKVVKIVIKSENLKVKTNLTTFHFLKFP